MEKKLVFEQLFKQYYEPLFCFACQFVSNEEECHDIVSDAFEDVWRKMEHIQDSTIKAYLYTAVRNRCVNYLRHAKVRQQYIDYCEKMTANYTKADELLEQEERNKWVAMAIKELTPPDDLIIKLYGSGKKYREIAEEMNLSMSFVKKVMSRATRKIREYIVKNVKNRDLFIS